MRPLTASQLIERIGTSSDNSLVAVADRLESTALIEIGSLPCWCITVVPINVPHTAWCLKLRAGYREFADFVRQHRDVAKQNPVVSDKSDYSMGRGEW